MREAVTNGLTYQMRPAMMGVRSANAELQSAYEQQRRYSLRQ